MKIGAGPFRTLIGTTLAIAVLGLPESAVAQIADDDVLGAWSAETYLLAEGSEYEVRGQIFFADGRWQVLFFVLDEDGEPRRGSGEGGMYERTSDGVVFRHLFNLSVGDELPGLSETPLRMTVREPADAPLEPTRVDVQGSVLTLHFPSGNRMIFRKAAGQGGGSATSG